ncbi:hypothetical protein [Micromonospora sp. NPDC051141]|uniref:hypothetical protein n=1 Tax=Micromonospora sp. NPDC051141 TaxID=3364284 RepID=UPI0037995BFA
MDVKVWMYLAYLAVSVGLTVWVARTLSRNGLVFLRDVFPDERLAEAVNSLLVVGFYLLNLGYVTVAMKESDPIGDASQALEQLSLKVGLVLLVLGALHFFNVFALGRYRRGRMRHRATHPPIPPAGMLPPPGVALPPPGVALPPQGAAHPPHGGPRPVQPAGPNPPAR